MKFYPVIIPTLNRYNHFKNCVESLAKCKYADKTELIIGLDYPAHVSHQAGYESIKSYIPSIKGFAKIIVFERTKNLGAKENLQELIQFSFKTNSAVILTEDDNIFAPTFLEFINSALETFESDSNITSICGYTPINQYRPHVDYIISPDASAWGFGFWRSKNYFATHDRERFAKNTIRSLKKSLKIFLTYPACLGMLMEMMSKGDAYGDTVRTSLNIIENRFQIKPSESLVRNMGQDGSGLHSGVNSNIYNNQILSSKESYVISRFSKFEKYKKIALFFYSLSHNKIKACIRIILILAKYLRLRWSL